MDDDISNYLTKIKKKGDKETKKKKTTRQTNKAITNKNPTQTNARYTQI